MTTLARVTVLVVLWLLAWGEVSIPNVLSGTAVALALLTAFPPARHAHGRVRLSLSGIIRLTAYVVAQLWNSNRLMARQILRPRPVTPGVLAHRLQHPSDEVITVMSSVIALSPGTMTVDVAPDSSAIYVHFFHLEDLARAHGSIGHLEDLAVAAIDRRPSAGQGEPTSKEAP